MPFKGPRREHAVDATTVRRGRWMWDDSTYLARSVPHLGHLRLERPQFSVEFTDLDFHRPSPRVGLSCISSPLAIPQSSGICGILYV